MKQNETIKELIKKLTVEEKISMIHGNGLFETAAVERLGIPSLRMSDGPMGVRREFPRESWEPADLSADYVSYLPSNMALAATWSENLACTLGNALGREARGRGKDVILAPGINIIRSPLAGRNFEYMSEDPLLISRLVVPLVKGIQSQDVAACVKHFVANNHEHNRMTISVNMNDQSLREIYFPGFKAAVEKGSVMTLMSAYNRFRGEFCSENPWLLKEMLRKEWKFDGVVISDWGAVHDTRSAASGGLDIEMHIHTKFNTHFLADPYLTGIKSGELPESDLDEKVENIIRLMFRLKMFDKGRSKGAYNAEKTRRDAVEIARESVVLLKNTAKHLPLVRRKDGKILVIGDNGNRIHSDGGGSAEVKALFEISPLMGLSMAAGGNMKVNYLQGYSSDKEASLEEQQRLQEEAIRTAENFDGAVILICGLDHNHDTEEFDRQELGLPYGQDRLIEAVLDLRPDTVVVNMSGSPVAMPWVDKADSLIQLFYSGMFTGQVLGEVVFGDINPSGKLPLTFPRTLEESPAHRFGQWPGDDTIYYNEGIFVGYRFNETYEVEPLFPFGHGLSYSSWKYGVVDVSVDGKMVSIDMDLVNSSSVPGAEVVQLYVEDLQKDRKRPSKELKEFRKVVLLPGEKKEMHFQVDSENLAYFDPKDNVMIQGSGRYRLHIGSSSRDIRRTIEFELP